MGPLTVIGEALGSLGKNKVRTALSVLGIIIGIAAVIAMVSVAAGAQRAVEREIAQMGDDWIVIWYEREQASGAQRQTAVRPNTARDDTLAILEECESVRAVSLTARHWRGTQAISSYGNHRTTVRGVEPPYFDIRRWRVQEGRVLTQYDLDLRNKVVWIGATVAEELFGDVYPIGETIRVDKGAYEVVGLLEPKGAGSSGEDYDDEIIMPLTTYQAGVGGNDPPRVFFIGATPGYTLDFTKEQIRNVMRRRHRLADEQPDDFRMFDRAENAQAREEVTRTMNFLLTLIASISLLVGGIGIMNIMLVSVTERTREIGLRMAIGANATQILGQFLCEAVVLCALGGLFGFLGGWALALFVEHQFEREAIISYWMAGIAVGFSSIIGVFFGFYPAWRASRLDPIEALRFE